MIFFFLDSKVIHCKKGLQSKNVLTVYIDTVSNLTSLTLHKIIEPCLITIVSKKKTPSSSK